MDVENKEMILNYILYKAHYSINKCGYCIVWHKGKQYKRYHLIAKEILEWIWDTKKQVVHHIDGNKQNDHPDNLQLMTNSEHQVLHHIGKAHSEEHKKKISKKMTGRKLSEEHKRKIGEAGKGRKCTEETRKKIREANKGEKNPNYGKHKKSKFKFCMSRFLPKTETALNPIQSSISPTFL